MIVRSKEKWAVRRVGTEQRVLLIKLHVSHIDH